MAEGLRPAGNVTSDALQTMFLAQNIKESREFDFNHAAKSSSCGIARIPSASEFIPSALCVA